jgi:very-short-patch-repair endonuclease
MTAEWKLKNPTDHWAGLKHTQKTREKMRLSAIKRIENQKLNGEPLFPCIGKEEKIFIKEARKYISFTIISQFPIGGYYIDGYIPELNLALEYDEEYNHTDKEKDFDRQKYIEEKLQCSFYRVSDKDWKQNKESIIQELKRIGKIV